jgi:hypothetical protein
MCSLGIPSYCQEEEEEDEDSDSDGAGSGRPDNRGRHLPRNRPSIYQKFTAVREMERLIEEGKTPGLKKLWRKLSPTFFKADMGPKVAFWEGGKRSVMISAGGRYLGTKWLTRIAGA